MSFLQSLADGQLQLTFARPGQSRTVVFVRAKFVTLNRPHRTGSVSPDPTSNEAAITNAQSGNFCLHFVLFDGVDFDYRRLDYINA